MSSRFAFYGRVSTEDQQDPDASRNWQLARARALTERHGEIVAEFFDVGQSRSIPWKRRPEANALLAQLKDPDRGFDAVVIGEPQRAFYGNQYGLTFPVFTHYGVASEDRRTLPRWEAALRLPARRRRSASEPGQGRRRQAAAPPRTRSQRRVEDADCPLVQLASFRRLLQAEPRVAKID